jgi:hypothetical protein
MVAVAGLSGCNSSKRNLPDAQDVTSVKIVIRGETQKVTVPREQVQRVLDLFNNGSKDGNPSKWEVMGKDLEIITKDGETIHIWLYSTYKGAGAFSIGPSLKERTYYRGSTDAEIESVIKQALEVAK